MMRTRMAAVAVFALVLAACGGGSESAQSDGNGDGGDGGDGPPPVDIDGDWDTVWGSSPTSVTFAADGNDVTGTYDYYDDGRFVGTLEGDVLTGHWIGGNWASCLEEKEGTTSWGRIEFTFTGDSFEGRWTNCDAPVDSSSSTWTGTRAGTAQADDVDETDGEEADETDGETDEGGDVMEPIGVLDAPLANDAPAVQVAGELAAADLCNDPVSAQLEVTTLPTLDDLNLHGQAALYEANGQLECNTSEGSRVVVTQFDTAQEAEFYACDRNAGGGPADWDTRAAGETTVRVIDANNQPDTAAMDAADEALSQGFRDSRDNPWSEVDCESVRDDGLGIREAGAMNNINYLTRNEVCESVGRTGEMTYGTSITEVCMTEDGRAFILDAMSNPNHLIQRMTTLARTAGCPAGEEVVGLDLHFSLVMTAPDLSTDSGQMTGTLTATPENVAALEQAQEIYGNGELIRLACD